MKTTGFDIRIAVDGRVLVDVRGFDFPQNEITILFGESGIGKSLISRALYGLLDPDEFDVTVNDEPYEAYINLPEVKAIRENSFFVFQEPSSHLTPLMTLREQLREGSLAKAQSEATILRELWTQEEAREEASVAAEKLLDVFPKPHRPSGGEKERMFLVMALKKIDMTIASARAGKECLFVFDEPTGSLDNHFRNVFLSLLFRRFKTHPFTVLLITHDYSIISEIAVAHKGLQDRIVFKELRRTKKGLVLEGFDSETYTGWLHRQQKGQSGRRKIHRLY